MIDFSSSTSLSPEYPNTYLIPEGREEIFANVLSTIQSNSGSNVPLVLYGEKGIGKSVVLEAIEHGHLGSDVVPLRLNGHVLQEQSDFISIKDWLLIAANACESHFAQMGLELTPVDPALTAADMQDLFRRQIMLPIVEFMGDRRFLLMIDHVDVLLDYPIFLSFLSYWQELLYKDDRFRLLLTLDRNPDEHANQLPFSNDAIRLGALSDAAAEKMIKSRAPFFVYDDVVTYIQRLTQNHPALIETIIENLGASWQGNQMQEITVSDVVDVAKRFLPGAYVSFDVIGGSNGELTSLFKPSRPSSTFDVTRWIAVLLALAFFSLAIVFLVPGGIDNIQAMIFPKAQSAVPVAVVSATPVATAALTETATPLPPTATPSPTMVVTPDDPPSPVVEAVASTEIIVTVVATATPPPPSPTHTATPEPGSQIIVRELDGMPVVQIPASVFLRGSAEDDAVADLDEKPQREVALAEFWIDQYEVSVQQYAGFLNAIGDHRERCADFDCVQVSSEVQGTYLIENRQQAEPYYAQATYASFPVNHVTWFGARSYCEWVGGRLPTEAEWEYVARGDSGSLYPWGDTPPDRSLAVFGTEFSRLLPVNALIDGASSAGVLGMAGGMWEWVSDWYDSEYYAWGPVDNPAGPPSGTERVARGGAWGPDNTEDRLRSANRNRYRPTASRADVGFRCVMDQPPS